MDKKKQSKGNAGDFQEYGFINKKTQVHKDKRKADKYKKPLALLVDTSNEEDDSVDGE
ncbi:MAG: hypothetical protein WCP97_05450 [bacterium]